MLPSILRHNQTVSVATSSRRRDTCQAPQQIICCFLFGKSNRSRSWAKLVSCQNNDGRANFSANAELFLKLAHHCAMQSPISRINYALWCPHICFVFDGTDVCLLLASLRFRCIWASFLVLAAVIGFYLGCFAWVAAFWWPKTRGAAGAQSLCNHRSNPWTTWSPISITKQN